MAVEHFANNYADARRAFLRQAEGRGASLDAHVLDARGPADEELTIDVAWLGPREPDRALVISSGTHGVEGFYGSAVQHRLLSEQLAGMSRPSGTALVLVHAVNPYGFAAVRRVNESNVDLNRNFIEHPEGELETPDYTALYALLNPPDMDPSAEQARIEKLFAVAAERGMEALQHIVSSGQYTHPKGIQFGGQRPEQSTRFIRELCATRLRGLSRVTWIDLHTGLGPYTSLQMLVTYPEGDPQFTRAQSIWGSRTASMKPGGKSVSSSLHGAMGDGVASVLGDGTPHAFGLAEVGTHDPVRVFLAFRADNWLHHHGQPAGEQADAIKAEMRECFCPADPGWRRDALHVGGQVIDQAWRELATAPPS